MILPYFSERAMDCRLFRNETIGLKFLRYDPPQYPQFWGEFHPNLSALRRSGEDIRRLSGKRQLLGRALAAT